MEHVPYEDRLRAEAVQSGEEKALGMDIKKFFIIRVVRHPYYKGTLEQVAHRSGGSCVSGDIQGEAGGGSEQPNLAVSVPVHCGGVELNDL